MSILKLLYGRLPLRPKTKMRLKHFALKYIRFPGIAPAFSPVRRSDANFKSVTADFCAPYRKTYRLDSLAVSEASPCTVAVHLHLFYLDLLDEFTGWLMNIPCPFDLFVSINDDSARQKILQSFGGCSNIRKIRVAAAENRGRDVAPMIVEFGLELSRYNLFLHIHSKKSPHLDACFDWRKHLLSGLLRDTSHVRRVFKLFELHPELGLLYTELHTELPYWALTTLVNEPEMRRLFSLICLEFPEDEKYPDFPAGTMFWARGAALERLLCSRISLGDFPEEAGQLDGTLAHAAEHSLCMIAAAAGYASAQIDAEARTANIGAGTRNLASYIVTSVSDMEAYLRQFRCAAFDIFGTLVCSSYKNDKALWLDVERQLGQAFAALRERSGACAKNKACAADIHHIYLEYRRLSGLTDAECEEVKALEFRLLAESCRKRAVISDVFGKLAADGYDVIAADDSVWPRPYMAQLLNMCGIPEPDMYLSCEYGLFKRGGGMYGLLARRFKGKPFVNIGDHELDDVLTPNERGVPAFHVMNPHDMIKICHLDKAYFDRCRDDPFCLSELMRQTAGR